MRLLLTCLLALAMALPAVCARADVPKKVPSTQPTAVFSGHVDEVVALVISPDGARAASASADKTVRIWDMTAHTQLHKLTGHARKVTSIAFSPDGKQLASGSDDNLVKVWDVKTGDQISELEGNRNRVNCLAFHPDGKRLLTGSCDSTIRVWDIETEKVLQKIQERGCALKVAATPDGKTVITGNIHGEVCVYELESGRRSRIISPRKPDQSHWFLGFVMSPDGKRIAASVLADGAGVWDIATGRQICFVDRGTIHAISPDNKRMALEVNYIISIADIDTAARLAHLDTPDRVANSAAFTPDGKLLLTGGTPNSWSGSNRDPAYCSLFLWDLAPLGIDKPR